MKMRRYIANSSFFARIKLQKKGRIGNAGVASWSRIGNTSVAYWSVKGATNVAFWSINGNTSVVNFLEKRHLCRLLIYKWRQQCHQFVWIATPVSPFGLENATPVSLVGLELVTIWSGKGDTGVTNWCLELATLVSQFGAWKWRH